jgi:hypothetical protein
VALTSPGVKRTTGEPVCCQYWCLAAVVIKEALTWSLPVGSVVEVELLESAQIRVAVINVLLEGGVAHAPGVLPVSAWQMAHGPPSVHLIAVASRDCHGANQRGQKDVPHDGGAASVCRRRLRISCREKAMSQREICSAVGRVIQVPRQETPCCLPHILYQSSNRRMLPCRR